MSLMGKTINFAPSVVCKTFEKRQAPSQVTATKALKSKIVFDNDDQAAIDVKEKGKQQTAVKHGGTAKKPKKTARKSPAPFRKRSPARKKKVTSRTK